MFKIQPEKTVVLISFRWLLLIVSVLNFCTCKVYAQPISQIVLTYNIRYANPDDGENIWGNRKEAVILNIKKENPSIFGLQEVLAEQLLEIEKSFPAYKCVGVGRDDGKKAGEFSPLFFDSLKYTLLSSSTFWLSETPSTPGSRGWDAACNRIVTWAKVKDKLSNRVFFVFCTHFDHMGEVARRKSSQLLLQTIDSLSGKLPAIVLGDFNATLDSEPYQILTDNSAVCHLVDSRIISLKSDGPEFTYSGFKVGEITGERIDYIFLKGHFAVDRYKTNADNNGHYYPSDHLPVSVDLKILD